MRLCGIKAAKVSAPASTWTTEAARTTRPAATGTTASRASSARATAAQHRTAKSSAHAAKAAAATKAAATTAAKQSWRARWSLPGIRCEHRFHLASDLIKTLANHRTHLAGLPAD
jgi:hypothetical protein